MYKVTYLPEINKFLDRQIFYNQQLPTLSEPAKCLMTKSSTTISASQKILTDQVSFLMCWYLIADIRNLNTSCLQHIQSDYDFLQCHLVYDARTDPISTWHYVSVIQVLKGLDTFENAITYQVFENYNLRMCCTESGCRICRQAKALGTVTQVQSLDYQSKENNGMKMLKGKIPHILIKNCIFLV